MIDRPLTPRERFFAWVIRDVGSLLLAVLVVTAIIEHVPFLRSWMHTVWSSMCH